MTTLSMFKRLAVALLIAAGAAVSAFGEEPKASIFSASFKNSMFFSNADVLDAYCGSWSGMQQVRFGDIVSGGRVSITYSKISPDKLAGIGRLTSNSGRSVSVLCYIYEDRGTLVLEVCTPSGVSNFYKGAIENRSVVWVPLYDFLKYDFQQDFFYTENSKRMMNSIGAREFENGGKTGLLRQNARLECLRGAYGAGEVNSSAEKSLKILDGSFKLDD